MDRAHELSVQHTANVAGGCQSRARRQRKQIDYSGNAYDNMMRAAILRQGREKEEENSRSRRSAMPDDRCGALNRSFLVCT